MEKGYVQIYTGNGKGKTTAALGLSLRAVCAGKTVFFGQFVKGMKYSETKCVDYLQGIEIKQFGKDCFIYNDPTKEDIKLAKEGLEEIKTILKEGNYDLVVLDELNIALFYELFNLDEVIQAINNRASHVEVIITGRYAPEELIDRKSVV